MTSNERERCFRELLERNHARWNGIARSYSDGSHRDDLLQEIMMQVWKSLGGFEGRSSIDTWAYRVALNTALGWQRTARRRTGNLRTNSTTIDHLSGQLKSDSYEMRVLDDFLASLSKTDRAVMLLFLDNVANSDAAEITGMTEGALRVRLHRIRRKFEEAHCDREVTHDA